jgi:adenosylcobinamide kinase/adenosylcobinamide-phosphate guanylyltransferase
MVTLVTGGARSGKSRHALALAEPYARRAFVATAVACDEEMRARIEAHRHQRGDRSHTIEEPRDLGGAVAALPAATEVVVIDCLTVWLANLVLAAPAVGTAEDPETFPEIGGFLARLAGRSGPHLVVVTNEVGLGIVPANPSTRAFRDLAGWVNQQAAALADRVVLMVCGLPLVVKGP